MRTVSAIKELAGDFISLLFPKVCIHCGRPLVYQEEHLCLACRTDLPKTNYHLIKDNPIEQKLVYEPKVCRASSYLHYLKRGSAQSIIHHLKYKGLGEIGLEVGKWYAEDLKESQWPLDFVVPVPLHKSKLKSRGYNQSAMIASGMAEVFNIPMRDELIIRTVRTKTQTRKSKVERLHNVHSIYKVMDTDAFTNKNILVVDDVLTTGATIGELVSLIARVTSVNEIYVAVLAAGD